MQKSKRHKKKKNVPPFKKLSFFKVSVCWLAAEKWLVFIGSYKRDMVSSLFPYIYCVILHTTVICIFLLSLVLFPNVMCTWWISVIMWWSSWRWMSGRRSTVSPNVWPSRLRWWLRKELGERQEARIKGSMKVENFLIMMYFLSFPSYQFVLRHLAQSTWCLYCVVIAWKVWDLKATKVGYVWLWPEAVENPAADSDAPD